MYNRDNFADNGLFKKVFSKLGFPYEKIDSYLTPYKKSVPVAL